MALDIEQLQDDIYPILAPLVTPEILILENEDAPRPKSSYTSFKITNIAPKGFARLGELDINELLPITVNYVVSLELSGFKDRAKNLVMNANFHIENSPVTLEAFSAIGLEQFNTPVVVDIPVLRDTEWEERSSSTITFYYAHTELVDVGVIEQITLDGNYIDPLGNVVLATSNTYDLTQT